MLDRIPVTSFWGSHSFKLRRSSRNNEEVGLFCTCVAKDLYFTLGNRPDLEADIKGCKYQLLTHAGTRVDGWLPRWRLLGTYEMALLLDLGRIRREKSHQLMYVATQEGGKAVSENSSQRSESWQEWISQVCLLSTYGPILVQLMSNKYSYLVLNKNSQTIRN